MKRIFISFLLFFWFLLSSKAQQESYVIQLSGVVVSEKALAPVPLTAVFRNQSSNGVFTDQNGFFTLPVFVGDTIVFSKIGYASNRYLVHVDSMCNRKSTVQVLNVDTISIPEVDIYPWPSVKSFHYEFLALRIHDTEREYAIANLNQAILTNITLDNHYNSNDSYRLNAKQRTDDLYYEGQPRSNPIESPFSLAWIAFFKALFDGSMKPQ